jgi:ankyrin repeat protein
MPILSESSRRFLRGNLHGFLVALLAALILFAPSAQAGKQEEALAAAHRGNSGSLSKLLENGAVSPNVVDKEGNSLLMIAVREGHLSAVTTLLRFHPQLDHRNRHGDSALMFAASRSDMKLLDLLLVNGAKTNPSGDEIAWTALHYAAFEGELPVVERLLAAGANINALTPNLSDALMLAARNGHTEVVRLLLKMPIDLNRRNDHDMTAEGWARSKGNTRIADLIAEARTTRGRR